MSTTPASAPPPATTRVRDRARDAVGVVVLSAACSSAAAVGLLLLTHLLPRLAR